MPLERKILSCLAVLVIVTGLNGCKKEDTPQTSSGIKMWVTSTNKSSLLKEVTSNLFVENSARYSTILEIDTTKRFQEIDGFGFALTGGSADLIQNKLTKVQRDSLLQNLFSDNGIAVSYLRISIGASDLDDHAFTYNDIAAGQTDEALKNFSIASDKANLIPLLKDILKINPALKLMASPWSAPAWMKTNNSLKAGSLKPNYYQAYANYFVKYLKAMLEEGITIEAITLQNEPENPNNNPSMLMTAAEQALFVKKYLGPAFKAASITTKIIVFDHNADHPEYPIAILNDKEAADFIDGSAFHLYLGQVDALSKVHEAHPDKNLYFTEQWTGAKGNFSGDFNWHVKNLIIGATQNWARTVLEWNLASDSNFAPHTEGGCTECRGAITIDNGFTKNVSYYIIGQASKFVKSGSIRIASSTSQDLPNVAFLTPKGEKVVIVLNEQSEARNVSIKQGNKYISVTVGASSAASIVW